MTALTTWKPSSIYYTLLTACALAVIAFGFAVNATAQTETILEPFSNGTQGGQPLAALIFDSAGNLYGTASQGGVLGQCGDFGNSGCGVVFKLSPSGGGWTETMLYAFTGGSDGADPEAGLVRDSAGNFYGTTYGGGNLSDCAPIGCGVVFELSPSGGGYTETVLYTFTGSTDGRYPKAGLVFDSAGNLYGTASAGGSSKSGCVYQHVNGCGVVFELTPGSGGSWTESVIHTFTGGNDGLGPLATLTLNAGNLFGTTYGGGTSNKGVVFEMKQVSGVWKFAAIHSFAGTDGQLPESSVSFNAAGDLFGTTVTGGTDFSGVIFEMKPGSGGAWQFGLLHTFTGGHDGNQPFATLLLDTAGNIYGTTSSGGKLSECFAAGCGVLFKLTPHTGGTWSETVLHTFVSDGTDGQTPLAGVVSDSAGNLYGTTPSGGVNGAGTVYEVTP